MQVTKATKVHKVHNVVFFVILSALCDPATFFSFESSYIEDAKVEKKQRLICVYLRLNLRDQRETLLEQLINSNTINLFSFLFPADLADLSAD